MQESENRHAGKQDSERDSSDNLNHRYFLGHKYLLAHDSMSERCRKILFEFFPIPSYLLTGEKDAKQDNTRQFR